MNADARHELESRYAQLRCRIEAEHARPVPDKVLIDHLSRELDTLQLQLKALDGAPGNNPLPPDWRGEDGGWAPAPPSRDPD